MISSTKYTSGISSKAASWGQIKTGQRKWPESVRSQQPSTWCGRSEQILLRYTT
jgi:hypothetical protein